MTVSSPKFFSAVCNKQYDELIQMYGHTAVEALQNYQNVQIRWSSRERNHNQRSSRGKYLALIVMQWCESELTYWLNNPPMPLHFLLKCSFCSVMPFKHI